MRWPAPKAARYIAQRLEETRRPLEVSFPFLFILALKTLAILPARLQLTLTSRMVRRSSQTGGEQ
jgi:hypothetical protein